ncbi:MAG: hypothetical protein ABI999_03000 [Acidobacteriota bacterium]
MSFVQLNWRPNRKEIRQFGAIFLGGFVLIGLIKLLWPWAWLFSKNETVGIIFIVIGVVVGGTGLTGTKVAMPFYLAWLGIAFVIGNVMSRVIITLIYFAVITPLGFLSSLAGRDRLQLKKRETDTYWSDISLPKEIEKYERQF